MKLVKTNTLSQIGLRLVACVLLVVAGYIAVANAGSMINAQTLGGDLTKVCVKKKYIVATQAEANAIKAKGYATEADCNAARSGIDPNQVVACNGSGEICAKGGTPPDSPYSYTAIGKCSSLGGAGTAPDGICYKRSQLQKSCTVNGKTYQSGECIASSQQCINGTVANGITECNVGSGACVVSETGTVSDFGAIIANGQCRSNTSDQKCVNGTFVSDPGTCGTPTGPNACATASTCINGKWCGADRQFTSISCSDTSASCGNTKDGACVSGLKLRCIDGKTYTDNSCPGDPGTPTGGGNAGGTGGTTPTDPDDGVTAVSCNPGATPGAGDNSCIITNVTATSMNYRCNLKTIAGNHQIAHRWERCKNAGTAPCNESNSDYIASGDLSGDNWTISCGQERTGSGTFPNFGCGRVQVDVQMSASGTSVAGLVYDYGSNCADTPQDPGDPGDPGDPVGPQCLSVTMSNTAPKVGDSVTFTCGQVAGASRYRFRVKLPDNRVVPLNVTGRVSAPLTISAPGAYKAQCQVCTGADDSTCNAFEAI